MLSGAGRTLILLIITITAAQKDVLDSTSPDPSRQALDLPGSAPPVRPPTRLHITASHLTKPGDVKRTPALSDKKTKNKLALDNNTGLRKTSAGGYGGSSKVLQDRNQPDSILVSPLSHRIVSYQIPDHESNRPGGPKLIEATQNSSKAAWITNRHPASLLHQISLFRKAVGKERTCFTACPKEREEREAYCHSDFAVNGIIHDVDAITLGIRLLTVLVNSRGLYKMNRLYVSPDGDFFRVRILVVDNPLCHTRCLHLTLGGRYIIMGQIYHRRMELPPAVQRVISGRLRAGDGLVTSGRSFIRRFNRKKDRRVLAAVLSKCK
ncbi:UPF0450 protein C17orf58 homolog isoform X2 [Dendropsophus ebraccatus]|uniref:UPF0450 protein C17orf58 homolog isoform X2 n=1 Tax=Dendropsophus ebraccatus TaxID=150705 RepID=UPI0038322B07